MSKAVNPPTPHSDSNLKSDELPLAGFKGTPEEIERQWFEQVYKGRGDSMPQLTWRAVIMGSVLGGVLSLTNLYIGLKAGWGFGVAITACILSYAIWSGMFKIGLAKTPMTILENNCMQSTASSAGYSTGGTLISGSGRVALGSDSALGTGTITFTAAAGNISSTGGATRTLGNALVFSNNATLGVTWPTWPQRINFDADLTKTQITTQ